MEDLNTMAPPEKAARLMELAREARQEGREPFAHAYYTQALNLYQGLGDELGKGSALVALADLAMHFNPTREAPMARRERLASEAEQIFRRLGDKRGLGRALRVLATA